MRHSRFSIILLCLVCAVALAVRLEGVAWPKLHPDELVIGNWIEQSAENGYIKDRVYPNGFFILARPFAWIQKTLVATDYWLGTTDGVTCFKCDNIYLARWLNALAGTAVCVLIFLLAAGITGSAWGGLFAAGLMALAQYAVEHSHYAETDIAALLTLTAALWLWGLSAGAGRMRIFALAALASGFAAGTKFTLVVLVPLALVEAVLFAWRDGRNNPGRAGQPVPLWRHALKLTCLAIVLFGVGFAMANPAVFWNFNWFWHGLTAEKHRVFSETILNLGAAHIHPAVKYIHHLRELNASAQTLGYPWLALVAISLPCLFLKFTRRYWSVLITFPLIYAAYWIFMAPWVRSQEFLLFLPSLAALAAVPLIVLWRSGRFVGRTLALLLAVSAIMASGLNGLRVASLFGWSDTRMLAKDWLQRRLPMDSRVAAEYYAEAAACIPARASFLPIRKIEQCGIVPLMDAQCDYLLRTPGIGGRGLCHPLTGELYPEPRMFYQQFLSGSELLCAWAPLPPQHRATFVSPVVELYGLRRFTPAISLQAELPQPVFIANHDQTENIRQTFCAVGRRLGCADGILIDRFLRTIAVGGPEALEKSVYLVLNTFERPADINVSGMGMHRKVHLDPYDVAVVPLQRPKGRISASQLETIDLKAEPVKDEIYIPCIARVVFTVDEAVRSFIDAGRADRINKCLPEALLDDEVNPGLRYLAAMRLGLWDVAQKNENNALLLQVGIEKCLGSGAESVSVDGCNGYYYNQFARARLQVPYDFACLVPVDRFGRTLPPNVITKLDLQLPGDGEDRQAGKGVGCVRELPLPVLLARGRYELRGDMMMLLNDKETTTVTPLEIRMNAADKNAACRIDVASDRWTHFSLSLQPARECQPVLHFQSPVPGHVYLKNMEIGWNLSNALMAVQSDLGLAAVEHSIHQGDWRKAAEHLTALQSEPAETNTLAVRQMQFMIAEGLKDDLARRQAARRLLELAPAHYQALAALAAEDGNAGKLTSALENNLAIPRLFAPWFALVAFAYHPETREVRCVFEALQNDTPPMAAVFLLQRHGEWRRKQIQSLTGGRHMHRGERAAVTVRLNEVFGPQPAMAELGLGLETDVQWHAGAIPLAEDGYVVPFSRLKQ